MVRECSKLMLRAYNAEADVLVKNMRPHKLAVAIDRLNRSRTIERLGQTMSTPGHRCRGRRDTNDRFRRARGRSGVAARLGQRLSDLFIGDIRELSSALGDELVAPSAQFLAVGQHVGETKLASNRTGHVGLQFALLDEADDGGAAQSEGLRSLPRGDLLVAVRMLIDWPWLSACTTRLRISYSCSVSSTRSCSPVPDRKNAGSRAP
jgi:hypothetical protein